MRAGLEKIHKAALDALRGCAGRKALVDARAAYLGRKGEIASLLKGLGKLPPEERREAGEAINRVKRAIEEEYDALLSAIDAAETAGSLASESVDVTLPGRRTQHGSLHPVTRVMGMVSEIFGRLGFETAEGPEVETDYYNFEALNIPADHPARDMQDTFYIEDGLVLRTHTSPVQIRVMKNRRPPLRIIAPGAVFRRDSDVSHTPMFHQVEGFMVDRGVSFADLKGVLTLFLTRLFGDDVAVRFRPSFFPFTEPSAEVDIRCVICAGDGCRVCKQSGWLEILGAGMIHPEVFRAVDYDPERFTGFAFGLGIERIAMLKYGIDDIRLFFENDLRFLGQF